MSSFPSNRKHEDTKMITHWTHFDLGQRRSIANMLAMGFLLKDMSKSLGVDPTSISKEIRRNRSQVAPGPGCPRLRRFPFVCDGCPKRYAKGQCACGKWRYLAAAAQGMADARLRQSREGIDATEEEFEAVDEAVKNGVAAGRSVFAISRDEAVAKVASTSTIYGWISSGIMTTKRIDLPKAAKYKKRARKAKGKYDYGGSSKKGKEGRGYLDYLRERRENPGAFGAQMDYLGSVATDKCAIFVVVIPELHYALGKKLRKGDSAAVAAFFDGLEEALGAEAFRRIFPTILTDNDPCFSDAAAIEFSKATGERRTSLFFCDPYVSNQKGSVENINGQLRRYFPKKGSVDGLSAEYVAQAFCNIDSAPVKSLGGETPKRAFEAVFGAEAERAIEAFMRG